MTLTDADMSATQKKLLPDVCQAHVATTSDKEVDLVINKLAPVVRGCMMVRH
jgi:hypothetical protein